MSGRSRQRKRKNGDVISSAAASPVNPSAIMATCLPKQMIAGYGRTASHCFAFFDRDLSCWKMSQGYFFAEWGKFSVGFPPSGTMRNGKLYRRTRLVPLTAEREFSLWPTPTASDAKRVKEFSLETLSKDFWKRQGGAYFTGALAAEFGWSQTARITAWAMGFPLTWTELKDSEMP